MIETEETKLIEQTAKKFKAFMVVGWFCCFVGVLLIFIGLPLESSAPLFIGIAMAVLGLITAVFARSLGWWHHG